MIYIVRTGCLWRDLPAHFGSWSSVYTRWRRWCQALLCPRFWISWPSRRTARSNVWMPRTSRCIRTRATRRAASKIMPSARTKGGLNTKLAARVDVGVQLPQQWISHGEESTLTVHVWGTLKDDRQPNDFTMDLHMEGAAGNVQQKFEFKPGDSVPTEVPIH